MNTTSINFSMSYFQSQKFNYQKTTAIVRVPETIDQIPTSKPVEVSVNS